MALHKLPYELLDLIVDYLEKDTLINLARTSQTLIASARRKLYRSIDIRWGNIFHFPLVILSRTLLRRPPIAKLVHTITLRGHSDRWTLTRSQGATFWSHVGRSYFTSKDTADVVGLLKHLPDCGGHMCDFEAGDTNVLVCITLCLTTHLRRLELQRDFLHTGYLLPHFFQTMRRNRSLDLPEFLPCLEEAVLNYDDSPCEGRCKAGAWGHDLLSELLKLPRIRCVDIHALSGRYLDESEISFSYLQELTLNHTTFQIWYSLKSILQKCPSLKVLDIQLEFGNNEDRAMDDLELLHSPRTKVDRSYISSALDSVKGTLEILRLSLCFWKRQEPFDRHRAHPMHDLCGTFGTLKDFERLRILEVPLYLLFQDTETNSPAANLSTIMPESLEELAIIDTLVPINHERWTVVHMENLFANYIAVKQSLKSFCLVLYNRSDSRKWTRKRIQNLSKACAGSDIHFEHRYLVRKYKYVVRSNRHLL